MLSVVANVDDIVFDVEAALGQQLGTQPLPFPGMDSESTIYYIMLYSVHFSGLILNCNKTWVNDE